MEGENDVVDSILSKVKKDPFAADLQISLFMSALHNYRHDSLLRPFPPQYLRENGEKDTNGLVSLKKLFNCILKNLMEGGELLIFARN